MVLDFENFRTIQNSVLDIMNIKVSELEELLLNWEFNNDSHADVQFYNYLKNNNFIKNKIEKVSWFHLTRTWNGDEPFQNGIQPLGQVINMIWTNIRSIWGSISENEFTSFKEKYIFESDRYNNKLTHCFNHGPFAMLIKEVSKKPKEVGNHDYLSIPEIIEDIFTKIKDKYNIDLSKDYRLNTRPTIVKFFQTENVEPYIGNALYYLHGKINNTGNELRANTCFDAKGAVIPFDQIEYVKFYK